MPAPIIVRPSQPEGHQCKPNHSKARIGHASIFIFKFGEPGWDWDGASPVVVKNGGEQFPVPSFIQPKSANSNEVVLFDRNTDIAEYKYTVKVVKDDGTKLVIDPIIENQ